MTDFSWDAAKFFERLTGANKFAQEHGYRFHPVSGLEGFHGALTNALQTKAFICVSDTSDGNFDLDNTPHASRVKTVFMAYRHKAADESKRNEAMDNMRELFRQFMSVLIQEKVRLEEGGIYVDSRIAFKEIDRYFFTGAACAFFQILTTTYPDIDYKPEEWLTEPIPKL